MLVHPRGPRPARRRGSAIAEFAVVVPLLFMIVIGLIEIGRLVMVAQVATNGSREAARYAAQGPADTATIDSYTRTYLAAAGIPNTTAATNNSTTVAVDYWTGTAWASTANPSGLAAGTQVRVTVGINFDRVTWLPARFFVGNGTVVQGASVARKE